MANPIKEFEKWWEIMINEHNSERTFRLVNRELAQLAFAAGAMYGLGEISKKLEKMKQASVGKGGSL